MAMRLGVTIVSLVATCALVARAAFIQPQKFLLIARHSQTKSYSTHVDCHRAATLRLAASEIEGAGESNVAADGGGASSLPPSPPTSVGPDILQPFLPAADHKYFVRGSIGDGDFVVFRAGSPTADELSNENLLRILKIECSDLEVNTLVWKCMGYRFDPEKELWNSDECFPKWREKFVVPPDLIGMRRIYSKEVDQPSLKANQALVRSVPVDNKQSLKTHLKPYGFRGYKYAELTPNKTRRAQCANWLLYYREELFGYSVEELRERRRLRKEVEEEAARKLREAENDQEEEWKAPVREVF